MVTVATECSGRWTGEQDPLARTGPGVRPTSTLPGPEELLVMAEGLAATARNWSGMTGLSTRRWELLAASDVFEAWVIGWPPGGTIALHDHGNSAGAVAVAAGELVETLVAQHRNGAVVTTSRRMATGTSWSMGGGHVHDIVNDGPAPAVSVHVYAPRLTSMTHYRLDGGVLLAEKTVRYRLDDVMP